MTEKIPFELGFYGGETDEAEIDLYDVSVALAGFNRSLALTTHLILNGEIIVQAPGLQGAQIRASLPVEGSWKLPIYLTISATALYNLGTAPKDTPLGHLIYSGYDYVVKQSLGFHVDYDDSLGESYEKAKKNELNIKKVEQYKFDSLIEKCETSIKDIHRPINGQGTAEVARIKGVTKKQKLKKIGSDFDENTYDYIKQSIRSKKAKKLYGRVSSYNSNTYSGRIFVPAVCFAVPFRLSLAAKNHVSISIITASLVASAQVEDNSEEGFIYFNAFKNTSINGRIKSYDIIEVLLPGT